MKQHYHLLSTRRFLIPLLLLISNILFAQGNRVDVFELMQRRDLRLSEIDAIAKRHFDVVGRVKGTGHKQYERWKFEQQFHLDDQGFILPPNYDALQYQTAGSTMTAAAAPAGAWTESGPRAWNRTSGWNPGVGRITAIAVSPVDPNTIYVTTPGGGIWKTTVGGNQWDPLADQDNTMMSMYAVAVHPTDPNMVFAGKSSQVIKSTDGGNTWTSRSGLVGTIYKILINTSNPMIVFAVGTSGISKSTDGGNTFVLKSAVRAEDIEFLPGNTGVMIASHNSIQRSVDGGETWITLGATQGITTSARTLVSVSPANPLRIYAVQASGSVFGRMYRSDDGGNTFITTVTGNPTAGTNYFGYETNGTGTTGQAGYDMAMTVNPLNADEVHIAGIICWKSTNAGTSFVAETAWSLPNSIGYNHADVHVLEWVGNTIYSGSDGGIYKSTDYGDNWTDLTPGLGIRQFYRIAVAKTNSTLLTGGSQDNGSSIMKTTGWIDWLGADGMDCLVSPLNPDILWGTSQYGSVYISTNGGASRSNLPNPGGGQWVTPLAIESNSNTIYGGWVGVFKSTNNGSTWANISGSVITASLSTLAVAPSNPGYIYASNGSTLYVTKDGGTSWASYAVPSITSFGVHPTNPEQVYVSTSNTTNRVLSSANAGASFTNVAGNLPSMSARSIVVDDTPEEGLYVAMNIGVYYKNKNLTSWVNLTDNLPQVAINEVEIHKVAGKIRIGTYGRGAWERPLYNPCNAPASATTTDVTVNGATLNWGAVTGATGYNVEYKPAAATTWASAASNTQATSVALTGLSQGTAFNWRVHVNCAAGSSDFATASFTTLSPCADPAGLQSAAVTTNSATLGWSAVSGALSYNLEYKTSAVSNWTAVNGLTTNSYNLSSLAEGTTYNWRVSATCTAGTGNPVAASFTTLVTCNVPVNLASSNVTATSASLSWSAVSGSSGYDVEIKTSSASTWTVKATNLTTTTYNLTGLAGGTVYDWRVRSNCGTSGYSAYSLAQLTTTVAPCSDMYEANNTSKQAKSIGYPSDITASIASGTDVDWFKFSTTNSASRIRLTLSDLAADYNIFLYDRSLREIGFGIQTGTTTELVTFNGTVTRTTYYVKVQGVNANAFNATQCYSLKVEASNTNFPAPTLDNETVMTTSAAEELKVQNSRWSIYPNPAKNHLNINYTSKLQGRGQLQVIDVTGRMLQNKTVDLRPGSNYLNLELKNYKKGMYMIKLTTDEESLSGKIMVE